MRIIFPILLLLIAGASFVMFTNPMYSEVKALRAESAQYNEALTNSRNLQQERDTLSEQYRQFTPEQISRLTKILPDSADNIRLIIDIQSIAQSYGMTLSTITFDAKETTEEEGSNGAVTQEEITRDYKTFNLEFTTNATYQNFLKFLRDLESSLRISDVQTIDFSSVQNAQGRTGYTYTVALKTYWLKD